MTWLVERGHGKTIRAIQRSYTLEQVELLYHLSRKQYFKNIDHEAKTTALRVVQLAFAEDPKPVLAEWMEGIA